MFARMNVCVGVYGETHCHAHATAVVAAVIAFIHIVAYIKAQPTTLCVSTLLHSLGRSVYIYLHIYYLHYQLGCE